MRTRHRKRSSCYTFLTASFLLINPGRQQAAVCSTICKNKITINSDTFLEQEINFKLACFYSKANRIPITTCHGSSSLDLRSLKNLSRQRLIERKVHRILATLGPRTLLRRRTQALRGHEGARAAGRGRRGGCSGGGRCGPEDRYAPTIAVASGTTAAAHYAIRSRRAEVAPGVHGTKLQTEWRIGTIIDCEVDWKACYGKFVGERDARLTYPRAEVSQLPESKVLVRRWDPPTCSILIRLWRKIRKVR